MATFSERSFSKGRDYAVGPGDHGLLLHRPDCPIVRAQAEAGMPVMTLFNCSQEPSDEAERCGCLDEVTQ